MSIVKKVEREIGGRIMSIETGKIAKQASGAVMVTYGGTVVLVTAVSDKPREGIDFFPLTVDYREKTSAAGRFPGGFIKREGRPSTKEILTMRNIDRPSRPLFPKGFRNEVQIQAIVLSADRQNDPDILAMVGASAALCISDIPFDGPTGTVRVGRINEEFVINPTDQQMQESDMDLVLSGHKEAVNMIELEASELSEEVVTEAIEFGHKVIIEVCEMIAELQADCGKEKYAFASPDTSELIEMMMGKLKDRYLENRTLKGKLERQDAMKALFDEFKAEVCPEDNPEPKFSPELVRMAIEDFEEEVIRQELMAGRRAAGRALDQVRDLSGEVALLPPHTWFGFVHPRRNSVARYRHFGYSRRRTDYRRYSRRISPVVHAAL